MIVTQEEKFADIIDELRPLNEEHWEEVAWYQDDIKLNPDYNKYKVLEENGMLQTITARAGEELIGYNIHLLSPNLHYSDHKYACNDVIFLLPEYRHGFAAYQLVTLAEASLREKGVSVVTYHMKLDHPFQHLMKTTGHNPQEMIFSKYVGD